MPREAGVEDESGRGLALVCALTQAWGDRPGAAGGRVVWAQLSAIGPLTGTVRPYRARGG